ncbi:hypothetical protein LK994_04455 [Ferruginibacter lapsinanis]|uniref:hypothetical protein n=1 Tax=Ferruginibacter lapsinanis TaxID=563172 RepID=UPI001E413149|nr:hypothetical protein [Ferruginibacter lapsinanis]UEG50724.1 hypothetical protein LK994_04455 [Ferruginibacter lapsinanis]
MTPKKFLGICLDHALAHLMELTTGPMETKTIESKFTNEEKEITLNKSEKGMHNKEQHLNSTYYKELCNIIKNYTDVILFGPTNAKNELMNILKEDHFFDTIKIEIAQADKMTENQQHTFVKEYFSKH